MENEVQVEVNDTEQIFQFRLVKGKESGEWSGQYRSIIKHTFSDGSTWYCCTAFWEGTFPELTPFQIFDAHEQKMRACRGLAALETLREVARSMA